jgi:hypothetical protein
MAALKLYGTPVWAVDISQVLPRMSGRENLVDLTYRISAITLQALRDEHLARAERVVRPRCSAVPWFEFTRLPELVRAGYRAGMEVPV